MDSLTTFIAGTKAKAQEVNSNFNKVKSAIDAVEVKSTQNELDIATLQSDKANVNGSSSETFAMANAVNSTDGVNKQYLQTELNEIANSRPYVNGLIISKASSNSIAVSAGSTFDSTNLQSMVLSGAVTKTNSTQAINTTYYIYLIAKAEGASVDVLISPSSTSPSMPTDYVFYRLLGEYYTTTDGVATTNDISKIVDYSRPNTRIAPDYANGVTKTWATSTTTSRHYTAPCDGFIICRFLVPAGTWTIWIDGVAVYQNALANCDNNLYSSMLPISHLSTYYVTGAGNSISNLIQFYPRKGEV